MYEKKPPTRGVVDSIAALRMGRYMTKGPGAKRAREPSKPTVDDLRGSLAKITKKKIKNRRNRAAK